MSFKPASGKRYFIIAKNSNLPLGVRGNSGGAGAQIEQQAWNPDSPQPQQHFQFDAAPNYYFYIKPGRRDLYLEPLDSRTGGGRADGTPIVQAVWNAGAGHQRFLLMPAGNDYYRIRCMHTGNFMDVYGNTSAVGAHVTQHQRTGTDNQLFRMVPVPDDRMPANTTSFRGYTDLTRMLVLGLAGAIPKVGGGIAALIGLLWPSDHDQRFWQQMKDYVDVRMTEMLQHQRLLNLEGRIAGLVKNLRLANDPDLPPTDRWTHLVAITTDATSIERDFLNPAHRDSHRIMSHLAAWGTLVLGANVQMVRDYDTMHPDMGAADRAKGKAVYKKALLDNLKTYTEAVATCRAEALQWRLDKIRYELLPSIASQMSIAYDTLTGWGKRYTSEPFHSRVMQSYEARRAQVTAQFEAEMDALLAPTRLWRFLDPAVTERPTSETVRRTVGPFPRRIGEAQPEEVAGTITSITLGRLGGELSGVVIGYADGRKRITGREHAYMETFHLEPGEYITNVSGLERSSYISALSFETSLGRILGTGAPTVSDNTIDFTAGLDDTLDARLTGLSGDVGQLNFHWEYRWEYDWTGTRPLAVAPALAEPATLLPVLMAQEAEAIDADPEQDFTTRELAAGEW